jgi:hypothetical protein
LDSFDKLEGTDLKAPIKITFIDQFGQGATVFPALCCWRARAGIDGGEVFKDLRCLILIEPYGWPTTVNYLQILTLTPPSVSFSLFPLFI